MEVSDVELGIPQLDLMGDKVDRPDAAVGG